MSSPLAKALLGKSVGDTVEVPAPGGARAYRDHRGSADAAAVGGARCARDRAGRGAGRRGAHPGCVLRTPTLPEPRRRARLRGRSVWLKLDNLQATGAFKERGAANRLALLTARERAAGVIAMSAGNHAQAVARHATLLGIASTIVMPKFTPSTKVMRTEGWGARGAARRDAGRGRRACA
jgi:hypothetical protein